MALDARLLAAQGFGFPLSPIALAVQGFIAWVKEEQRQKVNGSGGRKLAAPQPTQAKPTQDDDLIRQVIDKWEVIEAARAVDEIRSAGGSTHAPEPEISILTPGVKTDIGASVPSAASQEVFIDPAAELRADIARENMERAKLLSSFV